MSPPETEEQRLASGRAAIADARRWLGKRPGSRPDIPVVVTDAADDLERHVRELVGCMRPEVQARAGRKLLRIALEIGVTVPVGGAR